MPALPRFVAESAHGVETRVAAALAASARAAGWFGADGLARACASGVPLPGGRGGACVLALTSASGERIELVLRKLRRGGWLAPLLRERRASPARVLGELRVTSALYARGAPVPEPLLALARRRGAFWECAIGTRRAPGEPLHGALASAANEATRASALQAAAAALRAFHDCGGRHADLASGNVLVAAGARATVLDLDRARAGGPPPAARRAREIARLWRSLAKRGGAARLAPAERAAFVAAYCAGDAALKRALRPWLSLERARSAVHAWRYARS